MKGVRVEQMEGQNGPVKNQFIIRTEEGEYFQSYRTVVAFVPYGYAGENKPIQLDTEWNYSRTTTKYLNRFLGTEGKREIEKRIKAGVYVIARLN